MGSEPADDTALDGSASPGRGGILSLATTVGAAASRERLEGLCHWLWAHGGRWWSTELSSQAQEPCFGPD